MSELDQPTGNLEESPANLRAILDTVVDAIITIDEQGIMQSANPAAERMFGYPRAEMVGQNVSLLMPSPYREEHDDYLARYLSTGEAKIIGIGREVVGRKRDGTVFPIDLAVSAVRCGDVRLFTGVIRDMTHRKETEAALYESQRRLATLLSNLPGAAYRSRNDCTWTIEFISDGCLELTGYSAAQLMSGEVKLGRDLIHPEDKPVVQAQVQQDLDHGRPFQVIYRIRHATKGTRWVWEQGRGVRGSSGDVEAIEGFITDITQQQQAEEKLVQSERLAAIGQMVTGLAHESRNALQRAQASLEMLQLDLEDQPALLTLTSRTQAALEELRRLYEEVRNYATPIKLSLGRCDLADVWRTAWQHVLQAHAHCSVTLHEEVTSEAACVCDRYRIEQVFRNVLENAIAVSPEGGRITLRCEQIVRNDSPALCVTITDEGPGLSTEQQARIFEPFYTTKQKGTGLGLPICRRIVEAHGGTIDVVSSGSPGACMEIVLPQSMCQ